MNAFFLQLHITNRCNLHCVHCYNGMPYVIKELTPSEIRIAIEQFFDTYNYVLRNESRPAKVYIQVTGGEPLLHSQFEEVLDILSAYRDLVELRIMTNGLLLTPHILQKMHDVGILCIQVSIDGTKRTHDAIRGNGNFELVTKAIDMIKEYPFRLRVSFTACNKNYREYSKVAEFCMKHGVNAVWTDRFISTQKSCLKSLNRHQTKKYVYAVANEHARTARAAANRSLQFLGADMSVPYQCGAGDTLITVDSDGSILPCKRLPIICGNISDTTILEVYTNNPIFIQLQKHEIPSECSACAYSSQCRGGSRCMSYSVLGDYSRKDPGCFLLEDKTHILTDEKVILQNAIVIRKTRRSTTYRSKIGDGDYFVKTSTSFDFSHDCEILSLFSKAEPSIVPTLVCADRNKSIYLYLPFHHTYSISDNNLAVIQKLSKMIYNNSVINTAEALLPLPINETLKTHKNGYFELMSLRQAEIQACIEDDYITKEAFQIYAQTLCHMKNNDNACLVHGDMCISNILVDKIGDVKLIDYEYAMLSLKEFDLAKLAAIYVLHGIELERTEMQTDDCINCIELILKNCPCDLDCFIKALGCHIIITTIFHDSYFTSLTDRHQIYTVFLSAACDILLYSNLNFRNTFVSKLITRLMLEVQ